MNVKLPIVVLMLSAVIGSALGVVYTRYESRLLAVQLAELENQRDAVIAEWSRLQLEQAWLADASQIESTARRQLEMKRPEKTRILVVGH